MKHNTQIIRRYQHEKWFLSLVLVFIGAAFLLKVTEPKIISPCQNKDCKGTDVVGVFTTDQLIDIYSYTFGKSLWNQLRTKTLLHYMLLRESAYGNTTKCGDSGLACGPMQFHEPTYEEYRGIMISKGLAPTMGSRWSLEDSISTAAWAINDGRENAWGPVARGEIVL